MEQWIASLNGRLIDVVELAAFLDVPESWVYSRSAADDIPHVHVGRYVRFDISEVLAWLRENGN